MNENSVVVEAWNTVLFDKKVNAALRKTLSKYESPKGVWAPSSSWFISATAPAGGH